MPRILRGVLAEEAYRRAVLEKLDRIIRLLEEEEEDGPEMGGPAPDLLDEALHSASRSVENPVFDYTEERLDVE